MLKEIKRLDMVGDLNPAKRIDIRKKISEKLKGRKHFWSSKGIKRPDVSGELNPSKRPEVRKRISDRLVGREHIWSKGKKRPEHSKRMIGEKNPMYGKHPKVWITGLTKEVDERVRIISEKKKGQKRLDQKDRMLNGGSAYASSFIKNPSKPQVKTYNNIKEIYEDSILNYPLGNYSLDIGIPSLKICIEYDEPYWHQDKERDLKRQKEIESQGWKVIRYIGKVPTKEELKEDIRKGE